MTNKELEQHYMRMYNDVLWHGLYPSKEAKQKHLDFLMKQIISYRSLQ